jgi:hypothetical protein
VTSERDVKEDVNDKKDVTATPVASSWRTPPSQPRAQPPVLGHPTAGYGSYRTQEPFGASAGSSGNYPTIPGRIAMPKTWEDMSASEKLNSLRSEVDSLNRVAGSVARRIEEIRKELKAVESVVSARKEDEGVS